MARKPEPQTTNQSKRSKAPTPDDQEAAKALATAPPVKQMDNMKATIDAAEANDADRDESASDPKGDGKAGSKKTSK